LKPARARDKVKMRSELSALLADLRSVGRCIVMTNGCFDLLHPGHVRYLEAARALGDILVVAVNSDRSVRLLKGPGRPILSEDDRSEMVAALHCVDFVTVFDEETPHDIVRELEPDVLVKGGDWSLDKIVGRKTVEDRGGRVVAIGFEQGYSTTGIIERIREIHRDGAPAV
jgi:rfaE bifunctional protein nucleotidyltransferase chain/domain